MKGRSLWSSLTTWFSLPKFIIMLKNLPFFCWHCCSVAPALPRHFPSALRMFSAVCVCAVVFGGSSELTYVQVILIPEPALAAVTVSCTKVHESNILTAIARRINVLLV